MTQELTCIVCPLGCRLTVTLEGNVVTAVEGNTCPRGKTYAETECTHPTRVVTTTVKAKDGTLVAVKTANPIPKEHIFDCMQCINRACPDLPIHVGDVILEDVYGSPVVATQNAFG